MLQWKLKKLRDVALAELALNSEDPFDSLIAWGIGMKTLITYEGSLKNEDVIRLYDKLAR